MYYATAKLSVIQSAPPQNQLAYHSVQTTAVLWKRKWKTQNSKGIHDVVAKKLHKDSAETDCC